MNASTAFVGAGPLDNHIVAALPRATWNRWAPLLEPVELIAGETLYEVASTYPYVLFPTTAVISMIGLTRAGSSTEICFVGNDGAVGLSLFLGGNGTPGLPVVQNAGRAYRLRARLLEAEIHQGGPVLQTLLGYTQRMLDQIAQTALCNHYHSVDQRLSRRLLIGLDLSGTAELRITQEGVSNLLGVRRESVTAAANKLRRAGVISYNRGHIAVLDRRRLEERTCECYAVCKSGLDQPIPPIREVSTRPARRMGRTLVRRPELVAVAV